MIEIKKLTKKYDTRNESVRPLNGITLNLPNKGMVFICGKSGSGKSTLLNLIGGLDSITSGDIKVDGNSFSSFKTKDYDNYRNAYVGFIFQDFCLIDSYTVEENIKLSLDLKGSSDCKNITDILNAVGLSNYEKRYPRELSGGQKQRIAIARALIKNPKMILADEPTGNLDSKTAKQILRLLKKLSKDKLVVIVSHNLDDAREYADRIIELSDGHVVSDIERKKKRNRKLIDGDLITIPCTKRLTPTELDSINDRVKLGNVRIEQEYDEFIDTTQPNDDSKIKLESGFKLSLSNSTKVATKFLKGNHLGSVATSIMISIIVMLLCFSQMFASFNGRGLLEEAIEKKDSYSFVLHKGYYNESDVNKTLYTTRTVRVNESDAEFFKNQGYEGNIYYLYNNPISLTTSESTSLETGYIIGSSNFQNLYVKAAYGVLKTDKGFLKKLYGDENGNIKVLAGTLDIDNDDASIVITDYMADALIYYNPTKYVSDEYNKYEVIVNMEKINNRYNVAAIIDTGYKTKYKELMDTYNTILTYETKAEKNAALEKLKQGDAYLDFYSEVNKYLAIGYTFSTDYISALVSQGIVKKLNNAEIFSSDNKLLSEKSQLSYYGEEYFSNDKYDYSLNKGEIYVPSRLYNTWFGTNLTYKKQEGFQEKTITIKDYNHSRLDTDVASYTLTLTIKGLYHSDSSSLIIVDSEDYAFMTGYSIYPYAMYFDNAESGAMLNEVGEDRAFYVDDFYFKTIYVINNIVKIFSEIFKYASLALIFAGTILLISFAIRSVKKKMYEIGVLRALGAKTGQVARAFTLQVIYVGLITSILSITGIVMLEDSVNEILVTKLVQFTANKQIADLTIIKIQPVMTIITIIAIFVITLIASIVPIFSIRKIKPINIIRNKE